MTELESLWETVELWARRRELNRADCGICKNRLRRLIPEEEKFQAAVRRLAEAMNIAMVVGSRVCERPQKYCLWTGHEPGKNDRTKGADP